VSAVTRCFFTPVYEPHSSWSIVGWWERRRSIYNLAVGTAGLITLGSVSLTQLLPPRVPHVVGFPLTGILVYGVLANIAYTFGPVVDVLVRRRWGDRVAVVGPALFRYGFVFAVGLTLLPVPLSVIGWVVRLLGGAA
jgi:hypothetical protein